MAISWHFRKNIWDKKSIPTPHAGIQRTIS